MHYYSMYHACNMCLVYALNTIQIIYYYYTYHIRVSFQNFWQRILQGVLHWRLPCARYWSPIG